MNYTFLRFCAWFGNEVLYLQYNDFKEIHYGLISKSTKTPDYMMKFFIGVVFQHG